MSHDVAQADDNTSNLILSIVSELRPSKGLSKTEIKHGLTDMHDITVPSLKLKQNLNSLLAKGLLTMNGSRFRLGQSKKALKRKKKSNKGTSSATSSSSTTGLFSGLVSSNGSSSTRKKRKHEAAIAVPGSSGGKKSAKRMAKERKNSKKKIKLSTLNR
eukprot:CAMPEP_0175130826 /NCGR_PEP_ID=MMETSP0087-20121206/6209_1 /TAXON_ID=136419 /ORGANISM="Unknown Unknown, Strain D1" /LENGTH=158 /DNA_ID=CAMNT_0016413061 /DNA_START=26 /DNA_END=502 /DNA_ORIENTATION=+